MELQDRMLELSAKGFDCAQILLQLGMDLEGAHCPALLRAMGGLSSGVGYSGDLCGAMTGGCCLIAYFAGKGEPEELEAEGYAEVLRAFCDWFRETCEPVYGGCRCHQILEGDPSNQFERCPALVESVYEKVMELLQEYDILD